MGSKTRIEIPRERVAEFCRRHHIRRLSFFGSVISDHFTQDSDVDVLSAAEVQYAEACLFSA